MYLAVGEMSITSVVITLVARSFCEDFTHEIQFGPGQLETPFYDPIQFEDGSQVQLLNYQRYLITRALPSGSGAVNPTASGGGTPEDTYHPLMLEYDGNPTDITALKKKDNVDSAYQFGVDTLSKDGDSGDAICITINVSPDNLPGTLTWKCAAHSQMTGTFNILANTTTPPVTTTDAPLQSGSGNTASVTTPSSSVTDSTPSPPVKTTSSDSDSDGIVIGASVGGAAVVIGGSAFIYIMYFRGAAIGKHIYKSLL